jgi:sugar lactone lactonase YvrE
MAAFLLDGCDQEGTAVPRDAGTRADVVGAPDGGGGGGDAGTDASEAGPITPTFSTVTSFNPGGFQLPEGVVVRNEMAYVSLAPLGTILRVTPQGITSTYAQVPPGGNDGYTLGMAFDSQDNLFVTQTKNVPDAGVTPGVYKIPANHDGGLVSAPFATDALLSFPNAIALDGAGNLLVSDSASGVVAKVTPAGAVSTWKSDPELSGSPACAAPLPFPIGANGIVFTPGAVYVANTAKGSIVKVVVDGSGNAGAASTVIKDCQYVGLDGLAIDTDGTLLATQNGAPGRVLRVTQAGVVTVLGQAAPLDGPASIALAPNWGGERAALITSSAFFSVGVDGGTPKPALVKYGPLP